MTDGKDGWRICKSVKLPVDEWEFSLYREKDDSLNDERGIDDGGGGNDDNNDTVDI